MSQLLFCFFTSLENKGNTEWIQARVSWFLFLLSLLKPIRNGSR